MRLVARIKTISELEKLSQAGIDVFLADTSFSVRRVASFTNDELDNLASKVKEINKEVYVLINKMIHEDDLKKLNNLLEKIKVIGVNGIIIGDLTVYAIAKKMGIEELIIYQPGTYNTNSFDLEFFNDRKIKGITISKEITLEEIEKISANNHDIEISILGHGYIDMFYSKRKLLKNYAIHKGLTPEKLVDNYNLTLEEEVRKKERYPILEDYAGTHVFRSKKLQSFSEFAKLKKNINDFIINRIFISDEEYYSAIEVYKNLDKATDFLQKYGNEYDTGYYYKYTEKIKGENNES